MALLFLEDSINNCFLLHHFRGHYPPEPRSCFDRAGYKSRPFLRLEGRSPHATGHSDRRVDEMRGLVGRKPILGTVVSSRSVL